MTLGNEHVEPIHTPPDADEIQAEIQREWEYLYSVRTRLIRPASVGQQNTVQKESREGGPRPNDGTAKAA